MQRNLMKALLIMSSCLVLVWTGARGVEPQKLSGNNGSTRATLSSVKNPEPPQHSGKIAVAELIRNSYGIWITLLLSSVGLIGLLGELVRRAPEGYEDLRGFHFARPTPIRKRRRNPRLSQRRQRKRITTGWLIPAGRSFSSTH
jgi:hypothetical protein